MKYLSKTLPTRILAILLALCLCAAALLSCAPDVPLDAEQPEPTPDVSEEEPEPEQPPTATLPDDISVVFYTATDEEGAYIYDSSMCITSGWRVQVM